MFEKFLKFLKDWIFGFSIKRVLIVVAIIILGLFAYIICLSIFTPERGSTVVASMRSDATMIKIKLLKKTNYTILTEEIKETSLTSKEIDDMDLLLKYERISYYTKDVSGNIKFYITMIGKDQYKEYKLKDYEL